MHHLSSRFLVNVRFNQPLQVVQMSSDKSVLMETIVQFLCLLSKDVEEVSCVVLTVAVWSNGGWPERGGGGRGAGGGEEDSYLKLP